ncbi:fungal specific transcription factor [Fusarium albosuccineum]|uniref:Fungal specific transcription factor n=1 Tax=Fusarium albosuccineum TaxID=1237068 RepID=A0A8H4KZ13_9HYPO|nr:fungal specific transcription factor [Fusarium albosuccineum]
MADPQQLNPISCKRCRVKKIRCDRRVPECQRCREQGAECVYAERMPRRPPRTTADRVADLEIALSVVLQRLERIEENCRCHGTRKPFGALYGPSTTPGDESQYQSAPENAPDEIDDRVDSASPSLDIPAALPCSATSASEDQHALWAASDSDTSILQHAVDEVQRGIIHHQNALSRSLDESHIEPDLAKSWIQNCATTMSKLYHRCLRALSAWEPHATGTATDFVAAFFMVRLAAERFDIELSWDMFKRACQYAENIGLHRLDNTVSPILAGLDESGVDAGRKGFWELFTMDAYFHLIHNKPLVIIKSWCEAKVNLPWLVKSGLRTETATKTRFLIDSRLTFILIEFFQRLESSQAEPDLPTTEALCRDIEGLYEQWSIGEWVREMIASDGQLWTIAGVALEGYTCILAMLRRVVGPDIAKFPLAPKSSRHILEVVDLILSAFPCMGAVSVTFVVLQAHIPCECLASNLLRSAAPRDYQADATLIERVARGLLVISKDAVELVPLAAAVENLNAKSKIYTK